MTRQRLTEAAVEAPAGGLIVHREGPTYAHDLARAYNRRLAERDPKRADQIEMFVDHQGNMLLRHRPEWSAANLARQNAKTEREQRRWAEEYKLRERPFAPPDEADG